MFKTLFGLAFAAISLAWSGTAQAQVITHRAPAAIAEDPANHLTLELSNGGTVVIQLRPDAAPNHVYRIQQLASSGFYNGIIFHRVIEGFMAQGGDPTGTGQGGSQLPDLQEEFNRLPHVRGTFAMARAEDVNSANSQFYIVLHPRFNLDRDYTVLGRVMSGMQAVDNIAVGEPPADPTVIVRASIGGPLPAPPAAPAAPAAQAAPVEASEEPAPAE